VALRPQPLSVFFFSSRRRHTRFSRDWSSDVCSSDLRIQGKPVADHLGIFSIQPLYTNTCISTGCRSLLGLYACTLCKQHPDVSRSEERRVGKEWRSRWAA